jgi:hypothetical protein
MSSLPKAKKLFLELKTGCFSIRKQKIFGMEMRSYDQNKKSCSLFLPKLSKQKIMVLASPESDYLGRNCPLMNDAQLSQTAARARMQ